MVSGRPTARPWLPYTVAALAGLAVIAAAYLVVSPATGPDRSDCVRLEVNSSTEKSDLLATLAERYNRSDRRFGGRCAEISVHGLTSGKAMEWLSTGWRDTSLPVPQVWLPTSSLWTGQLRIIDEQAGREAQTPGKYPSIASSPLVIAMPQEKGEFIQQRGPLGWGEILGLSGSSGWAEHGRPEWGRFTFGRDNPNTSTSGLAATLAIYYAAVDRSNDLTVNDMDQPAVTQFVRRIEANVSHYSDDAVDLIRDLAEADAGGTASSDLSAIVMQEELVYLYNEGRVSPVPGQKPKVPLVTIHPKEGTYNLDHPYVVLPSASPTQKDAADDFLAFLQAAPQQRSFAAEGFRDHKGNASAELLRTVRSRATGALSYFAPPEPQVVAAMLDSWKTLRKKANILFAIDTSGSMKAPIGDRNRFQVATRAATNGVKLLNSEDRVGLWSFSSETPQRPKAPYSREIGLGPFDQTGFTRKLTGLRVNGGTALYATVRAAHRHVLDNYDPNRINAVVVLTDGRNEYKNDNDLDRLLADIALDPDRPVKIFCIAFDGESDFDTLDKIAKASAGKAFDARDPAKIDEAFVKLVSSF